MDKEQQEGYEEIKKRLNNIKDGDAFVCVIVNTEGVANVSLADKCKSLTLFRLIHDLERTIKVLKTNIK